MEASRKKATEKVLEAGVVEGLKQLSQGDAEFMGGAMEKTLGREAMDKLAAMGEGVNRATKDFTRGVDKVNEMRSLFNTTACNRPPIAPRPPPNRPPTAPNRNRVPHAALTPPYPHPSVMAAGAMAQGTVDLTGSALKGTLKVISLSLTHSLSLCPCFSFLSVSNSSTATLHFPVRKKN